MRKRAAQTRLGSALYTSESLSSLFGLSSGSLQTKPSVAMTTLSPAGVMRLQNHETAQTVDATLMPCVVTNATAGALWLTASFQGQRESISTVSSQSSVTLFRTP